MHSDGPDCGCWNLIYGTCSASDGQPMRSGQEMGAQVCVCVWVLFLILGCAFRLSVFVCVCP